MTDKEIEIVEELEKHTEVATMANGEIREFIDRSEFYKIAQELVKNIAYEPVLANGACSSIGYADCTHWQNSSNGCKGCNKTFKKHL